jgi:hypothetical protein
MASAARSTTLHGMTTTALHPSALDTAFRYETTEFPKGSP